MPESFGQISNLSPDALQDLAASLLAKRRAAKPLQAERIIRRSHSDQLPELSYAQEGLWLLDELGTGAAYTESVAFRIDGELVVPALERSLAEVIRRHDVLRARFVTSGQAGPRQLINSAGEFRLPVFALTPSSIDPWAEVTRYIAEVLEGPFDLANGPLFRVHLIRLGEREHVLYWSAHHIAWDLWSMGILIQELNILYASFVAGKPSPLPPLDAQYTDYAFWQREWLRSSEYDKQLAYWREQLEGAPLALNLPTDRPRPAQPSFTGERLWFSVSNEIASSIKKLISQEGVTLFMILAAAFSLTLSRWSGQKDVVVGTAIAGRKRKPTEAMIGLFVNVLPLRVKMDGHATFRELLRQVKNTALGAFAHQNIPFEKLVSELQGERDPARHPFFQVVFAVQNQITGSPSIAELKLTPIDIENQTAKFDLGMEFFESGSGLAGRVEYATDLFDQPTVERLLNSLQTLLAGIGENPDRRIAELPMLSDLETHQLVVDWNRTAVAFPRDLCIHSLFEEQANLIPHADALICGDQRFTYRQLNEQSNRFARFLVVNGVRLGDRVAFLADRSPRMIVALLGILKAGATYVPIDEQYPISRIEGLITDAAVALVLMRPHDQQRIPVGQLGARAVWLDEEQATRYDADDLRLSIPAQSPAYIIYTSGSTGGPKGVAVSHTAVNRLVRNTNYVEFVPGASMLCAASVAFDASTFEIWGCLLNGGRLVLARERVLNGEMLAELQSRHSIHSAFLTTSLFQSILDSDPASLRGLRQLIVGGEALSIEHAQRAIHLLPETALRNGYGPTECTTFACVFPLPKDFEPPIGSAMPIGKPIANTQAYILDQSFNVIPIGVEGELFLAGDGLANCYWRQPALTAEKFLPNPFDSGSRMYRTGDRARRLPDGNIVFAGRMDAQVKIRGFRVELAEIEATLMQHPGVREAVVVLREQAAHRQLVAYVVSAGFDVQALRSHLQQTLPNYMVPATFVRMDRFPLNINGKLDIKALPSPQHTDAAVQGYLAPRNHLEKVLCEAFANAVKLERIGIQDNFFVIGGDSILAIQIVAQCRQQGIQFELSEIFRRQTVEELAVIAVEGNAVSLNQDTETDGFPLTPTPLKVLEYLGDDFARNVPVTVWECSRRVSPQLLDRAIQCLVDRHDSLRLRLGKADGAWRLWSTGVDHAAGPALLDVVDVNSAESAADRQAALIENAQRLSLSVQPDSPPLLRAALLDFGHVSHQRFLLAMHHLAFDPVSLTLLIRDLEGIYLSLEADKELPELEKGTSFSSWARRVALFAESDALQAEAAYWRSLPWAKSRSLPANPHAGPDIESSPEVTTTALTRAETGLLLEKAQRELGVPLDEVLLACLAEALAVGTESRVVHIDVMHHGRTSLFPGLDVSRTAGWFSTEIPAVLDLSGTSSLEDSLRVVRDYLRGVSSGGIGYGLLRYVKKDRFLQDIPVAEIRLNHLGRMGSDSANSLFLARFGELEAQATSKLEKSIEVRTLLYDGCLEVQWLHDRAIHARETIDAAAESLLNNLRTIPSTSLQVAAVSGHAALIP